MKIKPPPYEGDRKRLGKLIRDARGNRTLKEFEKATGVSYATISKIENNAQYQPSENSLKKLISDNANPQNGVTYEEVMQAAGYISPNDSLFFKDEYINAGSSETEDNVEEKRENNSFNYTDKPLFNYKSAYSTAFPMKHSDEYNHKLAAESKYDKMVLSVIVNDMARSRIRFYYPEDSGHFKIRVGIRSTFMFELYNPENIINLWAIKILPDNGDFRYSLLGFVSRLLLNDINEKVKISYVLTNPNQYAYLKRTFENRPMPYRGEFSIILVDLEDMVVEDETYLANFNLNDHSQEFYIDNKNHK